MKSYLHFLFPVSLFGVWFVFLFSFSVRGFAHSLFFPYIFIFCFFLFSYCLLCVLAVFLIRRATNTHAVRVRGSPLILFTLFFRVCICICFPCTVCCMYVCCLRMVCVKLVTFSFSLFLLSEHLLAVSFAGCVSSRASYCHSCFPC